MKSYLSLLLSVTLIFPSSLAFAEDDSGDDTNLPRWARFGGEDSGEVKRLCSDVIDADTGQAFDNLEDKSQKVLHCTAAYNAGFTAKVQKILTAGWAATAAVCWVACGVGKTPYGQALEAACTATNIAQSANELVTGIAATHVLRQSVNWSQTAMGLVPLAVTGSTALGGRGGSSAPSGGGSEGGDSGGESSNQAMTCMTAATATLQTVMKGLSIRSAKKTLKESKDNIAEFDREYENQLQIQKAEMMERNLPRVSLSGSSGTGISRSGSGTNTTEAAGSSNNPAIESYRGSTMAALARNGSLPPTLKDSSLADAYQRTFGQSLDSIMDGIDPESSASAMIGSALSKTPAAEGLTQAGLAEELARIEREGLALAGSNRSLASYRGGGGGRSNTEDPFADQINGLMQGLMSSLAPQDQKKDQGAAGASELRFQHIRGRKAEDLISDPSVSIFDRISFRYSESRGKDLDALPWSTRYNQIMHGAPRSQTP